VIWGLIFSVFKIYKQIEFINMNTFTELDTTDPELDPILDFAVIGAGIAGLTAASKINDLGFVVGVFEKARGTGGRMSSKRVAGDNDNFMAFDLGCVSISAQSEDFSQQLKNWHLSGVLAPWWENDKGKTHYVAVPRNSGLTRHLSKNLECHFSTRVIAIEKLDDIWHIFTAEEQKLEGAKTLLARAKNIIIATPPAQAQNLLPANSTLKDKLDKVEVSPQWVMGIEVDNTLSGLPAIQYPDNGAIFSISQENSKPGRNDNQSHRDKGNSTTILQIQATPSWTRNYLELSSDQISNMLLHELERHLGHSLNIVNCYAHRWLYSCVTQGVQAKESYLWDVSGLGLIGDYINTNCDSESNGVESAWLSGKQMADWVALND
jgi:renalase